MREISFDESKKILISTLESIDKSCRENNIEYSICWGTMIGAIRHHGFVPWDDDIDLMMSRENYNRFIEVYNDPDYNVYTFKKGGNWNMLHTRVSNKKTAVFFNGEKDSPHGCWISIFPYDNVPDIDRKKWERKRTILIRLFQLKNAKWFPKASFLRNCVRIVGKQFLFFVSSYQMGIKVNRFLSQYDHQNTKEVALWDNGVSLTKFFYFPAEFFDSFIEVNFDGVKCKIIKEYDKFLRLYYGDYMTPPPVEKQVPSHNYKAYYLD